VGLVWIGLCVGLLAIAALIILVVQNTHGVQISFLWMRGSLPLASALLTAIAGTVVAIALVGAARRTPRGQRIERD
jgi:uncharacterized integral membrane protein